MARPLRAVVDLDAIRHNFNVARRLAPRSSTLAVVKANGYGHGALAIAGALSDVADGFGVASIEEAVELRDGGVRLPIVLLEGFFGSDELEYIDSQRLTCVVHSPHQTKAICEASLSRPIDVWLKLDCGMHRLGLNSVAFKQAYTSLIESPNVGRLVFMTHFSDADRDSAEPTVSQLRRFRRATAKTSIPTSLANSAAIMAWPLSHGSWIRPGLMLYGVSPFADQAVEGVSELIPAMRLESRLIATRPLEVGEGVGYGGRFVAERPMFIGVAAGGYGDGYPQGAADGTPIMVGGRRSRVVGKVSMDMTTVALDMNRSAQVGDTVEFWGPNLDIREVAECSGSSAYELLARLTRRVPLVYCSHQG